MLRDEVRPLLTGLDGVAEVTLSGIRDPQITIDVDTAAAAVHGVSLNGVMTLLQANGVRLPAGQLAPDTNSLTVEVGSPIPSVDALKDLYLPPAFGATGSIAGVPGTGGRIHPSAMLVPLQPPPAPPSPAPSMSPRPSATAATTSSAAPDRDTPPAALSLLQGRAPRRRPSVRATLVTAVSIIAMIVLDLGGYTLNLLTLGALTVAIGRVVDDSIVVIENIKRHLSYGRPRRGAILDAVGEVAGAVTASTVTTVAVFAPIVFVRGEVGELFRPFAVAVTAALLGSLLVSLTVVPMLSYALLRREADPGRRNRARSRRRSRLQRGYRPLLRAALRRPVVSLLVAVVIWGGTVARWHGGAGATAADELPR